MIEVRKTEKTTGNMWHQPNSKGTRQGTKVNSQTVTKMNTVPEQLEEYINI